jgi:hypothetical protein
VTERAPQTWTFHGVVNVIFCFVDKFVAIVEEQNMLISSDTVLLLPFITPVCLSFAAGPAEKVVCSGGSPVHQGKMLSM